MGYDITLGCRTWAEPDEDHPDGRWHVPDVGPYGSWDAPNGGECNYRAPSYIGWGEFVRVVGLEDVFFNKATGLMRNHPGIEPLTQAHLDAFEAAHYAYRDGHRSEVPGSCDCPECAPYIDPAKRECSVHNPLLNYNLTRLEWLVKWTRYALTTPSPAIENS